MIVRPLHFISTPRGVGKGLLPALGACLLPQQHLPTLLLALSPSLSLSLSGRQPTDPSERQEAAKECYFCVNWDSTALDYLWSLERDSSSQAPYELRTGNLGVFIVFWGVGVCLIKTAKEEEKKFFPDISTCYVCLTATY